MRIQGDTWKDVGAYNAGLKKTEQEQKRHRYANEVYNIYLALKKCIVILFIFTNPL
ncbi:hypothetical protein [Providencia rustigianii]|uniref:hypothetical protein n=1 Tax=Providencia rustigianii TaxID=158850 RepID=UPI0038B2C5AB